MSKIKKNILSISIAIILVLFIAYGISTFYKSPKRDDFCEEDISKKQAYSEEECLELGGRWDQSTTRPMPASVKTNDESEIETEDVTVEGQCDKDYTCRKEYDDEREIYNRDVFFISLVAGLIALIIGGVVLNLESVSTGIMGGGVLTIIYGTIRYWGDMSDVYRFIILGVVLVVLIWMGYKKLKS